MAEFSQGTTKRWGISWSFLPFRPRDVTPPPRKTDRSQGVSCPQALALRHIIPHSPRYIISSPLSASFTIPLIQRFLLLMSTILYKWENNVGIGAVSGNLWSRSARRKRQESPSSTEENKDIRLGFRITVTEEDDATSRVDVEWRIGTDVILFNSFCGKLKSIVHHT